MYACMFIYACPKLWRSVGLKRGERRDVWVESSAVSQCGDRRVRPR